jgi:ParB-like nuclease domain
MENIEFTKGVKPVSIDFIEPSPDNPRGIVTQDASFERLVSSIAEVGILVPLVVRQLGADRYQLVDGERRFLAAKRLRIPKVPAHVIGGEAHKKSLRKYMFHLHMTREQWEPLAQCKSLAEMYPELEDGLALNRKQEWADKIARETWMNARTAKDRVHVLAWPKSLKNRIYAYEETKPDRDIYSYVLAIEASIVEPSARTFVNFYNHGKPVDRKANAVRSSLFNKTISGMEVGLVTNREQIRSVEPLFKRDLNDAQLNIAVRIFVDLVEKPEFSYDDAFAQIESRMPELLAERPPKPQKLIGSIRSLTETLKIYKPEYIEGVKPETKRRRLKENLSSALSELIKAGKVLKDNIS